MTLENEIQCRHEYGGVTLTCSEAAFARLWAAVAAEAGPAVATAVPNHFVIMKVEPDLPPSPWWADALGWTGCGVVAAAILALLGAGAYTISNWFW